jgi:hypothetical protein
MHATRRIAIVAAILAGCTVSRCIPQATNFSEV